MTPVWVQLRFLRDDIVDYNDGAAAADDDEAQYVLYLMLWVTPPSMAKKIVLDIQIDF